MGKDGIEVENARKEKRHNSIDSDRKKIGAKAASVIDSMVGL